MERKLGRYELLRRLARGGMGEIYLARTRGAGGFEKKMIIKTILPHLAEEEEFVTKFLDEGHIVVQLTHGNIVPVFDMGEEDGEYYIAMEYVPGQDLRAVLRRLSHRGDELPVEFAIYIAAEICRGLGYAHRKTDSDGAPLHIVHRDVSPSNVLISHEGEVKLIDFGIARAAGKLSKTANGAIQGKCCYMSPEQARGAALDARSDIFSVGVLLYEMLTQVRPFEGRSDLESLELVRTCEYDPPGILRSEVSDELDQLLSRALALDPDDRYQSIDDLYVDLQHEMYRLGHPVTSQQLATSLAEVLSDEAPQPPKPANLDEALELELARLNEASEVTPSSPFINPENALLSLAQTATSQTPGTTTIAPATAPPPSPPDAPPCEGASIPPEVEKDAPLSERIDSYDPLDEPYSDSFSIEHSDSFSIESTEPPRTTSPRVAQFVTALLFLGIVAALAWFLLPADAVLSIESTPQGAQILLDGDELVGHRTPTRLELSPGAYTVELQLENHRSRRFRIDLAAREHLELGPDDLILPEIPAEPRTFSVIVDHPEATLLADGEDLRSNTTELTLAPGDVVNLTAQAPDCTNAYYTLTYNHQRRQIPLNLSCAPQQDTRPSRHEILRAAKAEGLSSITNRRIRERRILIESEPTGAEILVDDVLLGPSPVYAQVRENSEATIIARHDGYLPATRRVQSPRDLADNRVQLTLPEAPRGCLTLRIMYPANNEIAVNGTWLDGRHNFLREHPIPAGRNAITVRHPESEKEESFSIDIDPGDDCRVLTVWERETEL